MSFASLSKIFFILLLCFRTFWTVVCIICVGISTYHIHQNYKKWQDSPVIIGIDSKPTPIYEIPFPAFTVCPEVKADGSLNEEIFSSKEVNGSV